MDERFKVTVTPLPEGGVIAVELLRTREDAQTYFDDLLAEGSPVADLPYRAVSVEMCEFVNGTWTVLVKRPVILDGAGGERYHVRR